jgi:hypothetical protein
MIFRAAALNNQPLGSDRIGDVQSPRGGRVEVAIEAKRTISALRICPIPSLVIFIVNLGSGFVPRALISASYVNQSDNAIVQHSRNTC